MRNSLLAILTLGPCYGSQLKAEFERRTGRAWPLNVGQVYTTLARLERDGLVTRRAADGSGRELFDVTAAGRASTRSWLYSATPAGAAQRDEFVMKTVIAMTIPGVDVAAVLQAQERQEAEASVAIGTERDAALGGPAALIAAAQREQLAAQHRWIDWLRGQPASAPWSLDDELPKRGRPVRQALDV